MNQQEIERLADDILRPALAKFGYARSEIEFRRDEDGDPSIYVTAHFGTGSNVPGQDGLDVASALAIALRERGEDRWSYLRHQYDDEEVGAD